MEKLMLYKSVCTLRTIVKDDDSEEMVPQDNYTVTNTEGKQVHFVKFPSLPRNATLDKYFADLPGIEGARAKANPSHFWILRDTVSTEAVVSEAQKEIDEAKAEEKKARDKVRALKAARKAK